MKVYIKIHEDMFKEFKFFTYKQIMLFLYYCKNEYDNTNIKKVLYGTNRNRYKKDYEFISKYTEYIKDVRELDNKIDKKVLKKRKGIIPRYYKIKTSTYNLILKDKRISKINLLIILSFIKLYQITYQREHNISIKEFLTFTFGKYTKEYIIFLKETLAIVKSWQYQNGDVFLKDYSLTYNNLHVILDNKSVK